MAKKTNKAQGSSCLGTFLNVISLFFVILILLGIAGVIAMLARPSLADSIRAAVNMGVSAEPGATPTLVAVAVVPTTERRSGGVLAPTWTPGSTPLPSEPTATNTRRATLEPTITSTFPPATNTPTPTSTPTPTGTPGPSPTATNTRSAFLFTKSGTSPTYLQNFANNAGCNWLGIAGEVLDLNGNPVPGGRYRVHVWGSGIDERVPVGGAPAYSPSGYEQFLFDAPVVRDYNVQLETNNGTAVSQVYSVQTRASCNQNLLLFNFVQNHS